MHHIITNQSTNIEDHIIINQSYKDSTPRVSNFKFINVAALGQKYVVPYESLKAINSSIKL